MDKTHSTLIEFSIVIPTYNRPNYLKNCLTAAVNQDFLNNYEIVVVDDGGKIDLTSIIEEFKHFNNIRLIKQNNQGPAMARNNGVQNARGKTIVFLDDDCQPDEKWLSTLAPNCQPNNIVGGEIINNLKDNLYSESSQILVSFLYHFFKGTNQYFFTSNNFAISRSTFLSLNSFDPDFRTSAGEDREFCIRALNKGFELSYIPDAIVYHYHSMNFLQFIKLHFKYGTAAPLFMRKMKAQGVNLNIEDNKFYSRLFYYVNRFSKSKNHRRKLLILLILTQFANAGGILWARLTYSKQ